GCRLGRVRAVHHRLQHARRVARRPPLASAVPGSADHVLRARAAAAALLLHRLAFRAAGEGDDDRYQYAVGLVARLPPPAPRELRVAPRAAAADAGDQLALRPAHDRALHRVRAADRAGRAQERAAAGPG